MRRVGGEAEVSYRVRGSATLSGVIADRGTSQGAIARSAGISQPTLSNLIRGQRSCTAETAARIVQAINEVPGPSFTVDLLFESRVHLRAGSGAAIVSAGVAMGVSA